MIRPALAVVCLAAAGLTALPSFAQTPQAPSPQELTLKQAELIALQNHPQVKAAMYNALAAREVPSELRSVYYPQAHGDITGAGALPNSRVAAGVLNNPVIYNRLADGLTVSQFITDFGRSQNLTGAARAEASAQQENLQTTRADVLLQADRAYFQALEAQAVLKVAEETVKTRQLVADQVSELAKNKLKSGLDVSFANVNLQQAKLLLVKAQNDLQSAFAELSQALGYQQERSFVLVEEPMPPPPPAGLETLLAKAASQRPELQGLRFEHQAALHFARAERDLWFPRVSAVGTAGLLPAYQVPLTNRYAAAGLNIQIPIFNGPLFSSRRAEANLRAEAADQRLQDQTNLIARDVRVAWLNVGTAYQRLDLTTQLLAETRLASSLAQQRYQLGLSDIVALTQAQLNETQAEIDQATAQYDYQMQWADLRFQVGDLK